MQGHAGRELLGFWILAERRRGGLAIGETSAAVEPYGASGVCPWFLGGSVRSPVPRLRRPDRLVRDMAEANARSGSERPSRRRRYVDVAGRTLVNFSRRRGF